MLTDNFNRVINYLRISVTDRCNLRCRYCVDKDLPFFSHEEILSYEEIIRFVGIVASLGVRKVRLTGGEPLRRKGLPFLVKAIAANPQIEDISLTTNGVYLGDEIAELKEAGLRRVNISLDSLKRERFAFITGADLLDKVLESIEKALEGGLRPVKINTVIIRDFNDDEVTDFVEFARTRGVEVRFIEFMPFGETSMWDASKVISSASLQGLIEKRYCLQPAVNHERGPAHMFRVESDGPNVESRIEARGPSHELSHVGKIGFISPMSSHICASCNRIRLTSDGKLKPCLFSDTEFDLKKLLRGGSSDEEIARFATDIVRAKPERKFEGGVIRKCQRAMRNIGG